MKLMIATPTYIGLLHKQHIHSLIDNVNTLIKNGIEICYATTQRTIVHKAQNYLAKKALEVGCDLFLLEEDVILRSSDFILRAINKPSMIVVGPQADRNGARKICLWDKEWRPLEDIKTPVEVSICHTGATLIRHEVLQGVFKDFDEPFQAEETLDLGEGRQIKVINDGSFMYKAINKGFIPFAYPDLQVFHIGYNKFYTYDNNGYSNK